MDGILGVAAIARKHAGQPISALQAILAEDLKRGLSFAFRPLRVSGRQGSHALQTRHSADLS